MIRLQSERMQTQDTLIEAQGELISQLQAEVVELKRRLGTDSTNSSTPPSQVSTMGKPSRCLPSKTQAFGPISMRPV